MAQSNVKKELLKRLKEVAAHWKRFGLQLGIAYSDLEKLVPQKRQCEDCFQEMLNYLLKNVSYKWKTIYDALEFISQRALKESLKEIYPPDIQLRDVVLALKSVAYNWYTFGTFLGINDSILKAIQNKTSDNDCLTDVINMWCDMNGPDYPLDEVYEALKHIDRSVLAKELRDYFTGVQVNGREIETDSSDDQTITHNTQQQNDLSLNDLTLEECVAEQELLTTRLGEVNISEVTQPEVENVPSQYSKPQQVTEDSSDIWTRTSQVYQSPTEAS